MSLTEVSPSSTMRLPLGEPKCFTVVAINQVIWARVSDKVIVLKVVGEDDPIHIEESDELFNFYSKQFKTQKESMLKQSIGIA